MQIAERDRFVNSRISQYRRYEYYKTRIMLFVTKTRL